MWVAFLLLCACLVGLMVMSEIFASHEQVFNSTYHLASGAPKGEASFVTDVFELKGRDSDVKSSPRPTSPTTGFTSTTP